MNERDEYIAQVTIGEQPENVEILLAEYNPAWPSLYEREAEKLQKALGNKALQIHHVGSTSVPGLCAKPVIDILLLVKDAADEPDYLPEMLGAGYTLRIREPDWFEHRMFKGSDTDINLHVFSEDCDEPARMLAFRDRLRASEEERSLYAGVKRELSKRSWQHVQHYADAKSEVVAEIIARAIERVPDKNLFMMCEVLNKTATALLPDGFAFRYCRRDELEVWKSLHIDEPEQRDAYNRVLLDYYDRVYAKYGDLFFNRCVFVCDKKDIPVATCFIWKAYGKVNTLHWLKVSKQYEGLGIGRALLSRVMATLADAEYPVFLHTHPSSYRAIKLYSDFGFALLTDAQIGFRANDITDALPILKKYMPKHVYSKLVFKKAPQFFWDAAQSSEAEEF
ncbi:GNAT family N-acetyltransferase [Ruminococcaceae bacterium OttesenSCG-928-I18]|nr:GNAT family N-acetyltransferase [Ruminococcaceae bacterium OttesenSCG-928-I18]